MTDRSLRADQLAHARRTNPQPDDDLRSRITEALNTTPAQFIQDDPDEGEWFKDRPYRRHDQHRYDGGCAMCRGETDTLVQAVLAVVQPELDRLAAERGALLTALVRAGIVRADDTPAEMLEHIAATGEQVNAITWGTACLSCARVLDGSIQETERAEKAEAERDRLAKELADWRAAAYKATAERDEACTKVRAVEVIRVWRNEDGKKFMFADEVALALGVVTQEQLDRAAAEPATPTEES